MRLNLFKLEKLKIISYDDSERDSRGKAVVFEVMFNPESISIHHGNTYSSRKPINTPGKETYIYTDFDRLQLDLVMDGTGVADYGFATLRGAGTPSVAKQIDTFKTLCFHENGEKHQPKFLKIQWGEGVLQDFHCRLASVDIQYTLFARNGAPLRALLKASFFRAVPPPKPRSSPDLSHTRLVKSGDTLPLLSKEIYGSSDYYLRVAQANNLDDFRNLTPGQPLIFPPLAGK
jgi:LysM repeat protein